MSSQEIGDITENLELLETLLLKAEQSIKIEPITPQVVQIMFRYAHNAKGAIGILGLDDCQRLLHAFESILDHVRRGQAFLSPELIDRGLGAVIALIKFLESRENGDEIRSMAEELSQELAGFESGSSNVIAKVSFPITGKASEKLSDSGRNGYKAFVVNKTISSEISKENFETLPVYSDIKFAGGEWIATWPSHERIDKSLDQQVIQLLFVSKNELSAIRNAIYDPVVEAEFTPKEILPEPEELPISTSPSVPAPHVRRILIAEDELICRKVLTRMLSPYGDLEVTVDGQEALVCFLLAIEEGTPFDFVFLDINLPTLDGRSTLRYLRKIEEERGVSARNPCKVIMATVSKATCDVLGSFKEGCEGYLVKPVDKSKLETILGKLGVSSPPSRVEEALEK